MYSLSSHTHTHTHGAKKTIDAYLGAQQLKYGTRLQLHLSYTVPELAVGTLAPGVECPRFWGGMTSTLASTPIRANAHAPPHARTHIHERT
jgi:hypothetical protein